MKNGSIKSDPLGSCSTHIPIQDFVKWLLIWWQSHLGNPVILLQGTSVHIPSITNKNQHHSICQNWGPKFSGLRTTSAQLHLSPPLTVPRFRTECALAQLPCWAGLIFIQTYWGRRQGLRVGPGGFDRSVDFVQKSDKLTSWGKGGLSRYLRGFTHPKWLLGISEPSTDRWNLNHPQICETQISRAMPSPYYPYAWVFQKSTSWDMLFFKIMIRAYTNGLYWGMIGWQIVWCCAKIKIDRFTIVWGIVANDQVVVSVSLGIKHQPEVPTDKWLRTVCKK